MKRLVSTSIILGAAVIAALATLRNRPADVAGRFAPADDPTTPAALVDRAEDTGSPPASGEDGVQDGLASANASPDWSLRFHATDDYWAFVETAAPAAAAGDARAQFLIAEALGKCETAVAPLRERYVLENMTADQLFEETFLESASPSLPAPYIEFSRQQFLKCAGFLDGEPPVFETLGVGPAAHTRDYWVGLAIENGDALAVVQAAYLAAAKLDTVPADTRGGAIEEIEQQIALVMESSDPEALYRLGALVALIGSADAADSAALTITACETGFDCTYSNPALGQGCVRLGLCSGGESILTSMQADLGPLYGHAYAKSQEIRYRLQVGQADDVSAALLSRLQFPR